MLTGSPCEAMLSALCQAKRHDDLGLVMLVDREKANGNIHQGVRDYIAERVDTDSYLAQPVTLDEGAAEGLEVGEYLLKSYKKEQLAMINSCANGRSHDNIRRPIQQAGDSRVIYRREIVTWGN